MPNAYKNDWRKESLFRCECGESHFISVTYYKDDEKYPGYFSISSDDRCNGHWWVRLKAALHILFKRNHTWTEVILNEDTANQVIESLQAIPWAK